MNSLQSLELDASCFPAFMAAATELSFTKAAEKIGLTQSGISQKIARLEEQLGVDLFIRVNRRVILTDAGQQLFAYVERLREDTAQLFEKVGMGKSEVSGTVRYAMPHSCLFTPHFPQLLQDRKNYPKVFIQVELCPNEAVISKLLTNEIDFGFITRPCQNPAIYHEAFAKEEYVLVGPKNTTLEKEWSTDSVMKLPFVDYPGMSVLFEIWRERTFPNSRRLTYESLQIEGKINNLPGAVTMLTHGLGWTIISEHVVKNEINQNKITIYPKKNRQPVVSDIFIVMLADSRLPTRVKTVLNAFRKMKSDKNTNLILDGRKQGTVASDKV